MKYEKICLVGILIEIQKSIFILINGWKNKLFYIINKKQKIFFSSIYKIATWEVRKFLNSQYIK